MSRRGFLSTLGAASAGLILGMPGVALGRPANAARVVKAGLNTYDRALIRSTLEEMFDRLGGLGDIVRPGDRIGIKINLTGGNWNADSFLIRTGVRPEDSYWTHPEILRATCELLTDAGAGEIYVLEAVTDTSYYDWGYADAVSHLDTTFVNLNEPAPYDSFVTRSVGENAIIYETFEQNALLGELDCLVSLAKSKQHGDAGVTHGLKNMVGTIPMAHYSLQNVNRDVIHNNTSLDGIKENNLVRIILDLNNATPIHLVVNDAIKTVLGGEGPWHAGLTPATYDTLVASKDPVAADAVATLALGFDPTQDRGSATFPDALNYLKLASELGMGVYDPAAMEVVATATEDLPVASPIDMTCYPNPFSTEAVFEVTLTRSAYVTLTLYDVAGRRVARVASGSLPAGVNKIGWNGGGLPSGVYVAILQGDGARITRKLVKID